MMFKEQAEKCRRQAGEFAGRPEAPFLLRVASAFDELAIEADARLITGKARESAQPLNA
ncbi:MAG: hypothetical protein ACTHOI_05560 [Sphingomicrobium sp.]